MNIIIAIIIATFLLLQPVFAMMWANKEFRHYHCNRWTRMATLIFCLAFVWSLSGFVHGLAILATADVYRAQQMETAEKSVLDSLQKRNEVLSSNCSQKPTEVSHGERYQHLEKE